MNFFGCRYACRYLIPAIIAAGALAICPISMAAEATIPVGAPEEDSTAPEDSLPGPLGLGVTGASAGITTDYFEQVVTDALVTSGIFSGVDHSETVDSVMPMIRAKGVFPGTPEIDNTPYFLDIRIVKLDTPTFSIYMTVGMNVIWTLYRTADKTELLHERIYSTYTGGMFEGGIHGANRVRVASEGATRENVAAGVGMLEALDLDQDIGYEPQQASVSQESAQE